MYCVQEKYFLLRLSGHIFSTNCSLYSFILIVLQLYVWLLKPFLLYYRIFFLYVFFFSCLKRNARLCVWVFCFFLFLFAFKKTVGFLLRKKMKIFVWKRKKIQCQLYFYLNLRLAPGYYKFCKYWKELSAYRKRKICRKCRL